jgi:hypothetical protein
MSTPYLPADPKTIRAFVEDRVKSGKKPATIKRHEAAIGRVHIAAGLLNPCSSGEAVRLGLTKRARDVCPTGPSASVGLEGHQGIRRERWRGLRADREPIVCCWCSVLRSIVTMIKLDETFLRELKLRFTQPEI